MGLRIARATRQISNGLSAAIPLNLPHIEGTLIIPKVVTFATDLMTGDSRMSCGLSFHRDIVLPTPITGDLFQNPYVWLPHVFSYRGGSGLTTHIDVTQFEMELGGPQAFIVFNGEASPRWFHCVMWYDTRQVEDVHWADIATRTSFED